MMKAATDHDPIAAVTTKFLRDEPAFRPSQVFGPRVRAGNSGGKRLITGDQAGISLLKRRAGSRLDYRMSLLAQPGDIVLVRHREAAFEDYLRGVLGLTDVTFLSPKTVTTAPLLSCARTCAALQDEIVARLSGEAATILPYQTTGDAWRLAQEIGDRTRRAVSIAGPAPRISRRANDKLWFSALARSVLGQDAVPPTFAAYGPAGAAALVTRFARTEKQVIVKVPDSAGSAGNLRIDSTDIAGWTMKKLRDFLAKRLAMMGWIGEYPLLVGVWDQNVITSPSVQMTIPQSVDGPAIPLGVFEQAVKGDVAEFVGAAPATLPEALIERLEAEATSLGTVLQNLGYYGACSFDAVVTGDLGAPARQMNIHWIECNGRWTGVSIPFCAATRHLGVQPPGFLVTQDRLSASITTDQIVDRLAELLFCEGGAEGVLLMAPPSLDPKSFVILATVGHDQRSAVLIAAEALKRLDKRS